MIKTLWRKLFPKRYLIRAYNGTWYDDEGVWETCWYEIWMPKEYPYEFKIVAGGYKPKSHTLYAEVLKVANNIQLELLDQSKQKTGTS